MPVHGQCRSKTPSDLQPIWTVRTASRVSNHAAPPVTSSLVKHEVLRPSTTAEEETSRGTSGGKRNLTRRRSTASQPSVGSITEPIPKFPGVNEHGAGLEGELTRLSIDKARNVAVHSKSQQNAANTRMNHYPWLGVATTMTAYRKVIVQSESVAWSCYRGTRGSERMGFRISWDGARQQPAEAYRSHSDHGSLERGPAWTAASAREAFHVHICYLVRSFVTDDNYNRHSPESIHSVADYDVSPYEGHHRPHNQLPPSPSIPLNRVKRSSTDDCGVPNWRAWGKLEGWPLAEERANLFRLLTRNGTTIWR
ncbi:hypothetical protein M378DRAFT_11235 [Amanita muscaria Koide BX008]|uniref:Uncharacterized protein n=1 Tax=Amanita muscaria (strain Koide BX008) TaxID=946122 RepID=A0A0C2X828_AMAMK|nr:hypothetical protein M378DRAFT_11235 [Amanita muscaria Koide BX008]